MTGNKFRILSTRPLYPPLTTQAAEKGILLESLAFIETHPILDERLCTKITEIAAQTAIVVFTSMNAVDAVAACLTTAGSKPQAAHTEEQAAGIAKSAFAAGWRIFCIGSATRDRVHAHLGEDRIAGTADSATGLADVIIGHGEIKEVVFFCGDQRRDELPKKLWDADIRVKEYVVYQTKATPHTITATYDGLVFFSPSAVDSFFSANTLPADTMLFAIGHTTADAIRSYCINPVIVSSSTGKDALIRQVINHFE